MYHIKPSLNVDYCPEIFRALDGVRYIAECTKQEEDSVKVASTHVLFVRFSVK